MKRNINKDRKTDGKHNLLEYAGGWVIQILCQFYCNYLSLKGWIKTGTYDRNQWIISFYDKYCSLDKEIKTNTDIGNHYIDRFLL